MFECVLEGLTLKRLLESLKDLCSDINLCCSEEGCHMQTMDANHVALIDMKWGFDFFIKYRCDAPVNLGLSIQTLLRAVHPVKSNTSTVHLSTMQGAADEEETLHITIEDLDSDDTWHVDIALIEVEQEMMVIPEDTATASGTVDAKNFQELIKYLHSISDNVSVKCEKDKLMLAAKGDNINVTKMMKLEDMNSLSIVEHNFSSRYLAMFMKGAAISDRMRLSLSEGIPLLFRFALPLPEQNRSIHSMDQDPMSYLSLYLSPRLDGN